MEYRSSKSDVIIFGIGTGFLSVVNLLMGIIWPGISHKIFLISMGVLLGFISAACFTYRCVLRIDVHQKLVEKRTSALFFSLRRSYSFAAFYGVGIGTGGGGATWTVYTLYWVQLLGSPNVTVPGYATNKEEALRKAYEIAKAMNLPVDEHQRMIFFSKRI